MNEQVPGTELVDRVWSPGKAVLAGLLGALVNSAAIHLSRALGLDAGTSGLSKWLAAHLDYWFRLSLPLHLRPAAQEAFHTAVGTFAALLYAAFFYRRLPGPGWFRGLVFCQVLWAAQSLVVLPWLGKGYFGQGISASAPLWSWCLNAVFGLVLGALYRPQERRSRTAEK